MFWKGFPLDYLGFLSLIFTLTGQLGFNFHPLPLAKYAASYWTQNRSLQFPSGSCQPLRYPASFSDFGQCLVLLQQILVILIIPNKRIYWLLFLIHISINNKPFLPLPLVLTVAKICKVKNMENQGKIFGFFMLRSWCYAIFMTFQDIKN